MYGNFNLHGGRSARIASHPPATLERSDCGLGNDAGGAERIRHRGTEAQASPKRFHRREAAMVDKFHRREAAMVDKPAG